MPRKSRFFSGGFIDILSLIVVVFFVITTVIGAVVINKQNANFDLRDKAMYTEEGGTGGDVAPIPTPYCSRTCTGNQYCKPDTTGGTCVIDITQPNTPSTTTTATTAQTTASYVSNGTCLDPGQSCQNGNYFDSSCAVTETRCGTKPVQTTSTATNTITTPQTSTTSCSSLGTCYPNTYTCEKSYGQMNCGAGKICGAHCSAPSNIQCDAQQFCDQLVSRGATQTCIENPQGSNKYVIGLVHSSGTYYTNTNCTPSQLVGVVNAVANLPVGAQCSADSQCKQGKCYSTNLSLTGESAYICAGSQLEASALADANSIKNVATNPNTLMQVTLAGTLFALTQNPGTAQYVQPIVQNVMNVLPLAFGVQTVIDCQKYGTNSNQCINGAGGTYATYQMAVDQQMIQSLGYQQTTSYQIQQAKQLIIDNPNDAAVARDALNPIIDKLVAQGKTPYEAITEVTSKIVPAYPTTATEQALLSQADKAKTLGELLDCPFSVCRYNTAATNVIANNYGYNTSTLAMRLEGQSGSFGHAMTTIIDPNVPGGLVFLDATNNLVFNSAGEVMNMFGSQGRTTAAEIMGRVLSPGSPTGYSVSSFNLMP